MDWTVAEAGDKVGRGTAPHTVSLMDLAAQLICPQYGTDIRAEAAADD